MQLLSRSNKLYETELSIQIRKVHIVEVLMEPSVIMSITIVADDIDCEGTGYKIVGFGAPGYPM